MAPDLLESLTNREREVLGLIGQGLSLAEIADRLYRSQKTIQTHRLSLGRKLGASNRVELARFAIQAGLAPLDSPVTDGHSTPGDDALIHDSNAWRAFQAIAHDVDHAGGPRYFRLLAESIVRRLGVATAGISELVENGQWFHTLAITQRGQVSEEELTYPVARSACELALQAPLTFVRGHVQQQFPDDHNLARMNAHAYLAARLDDEHGKPIGVLWVVHPQAIDESNEPDKVMSIVAKRAAVELLRWRVFNEVMELREALEERVEARTAELASANAELERTVEQLRAAHTRTREQEKRFELLVETISDGLGVTDHNHRLIYANQTLRQLVGRSAQQMIGHAPSAWMPPEEAKRFDELSTDPPKAERSPYHTTFVRPSGEHVRVFVRPRSIFDENGRYRGAVAVVTEATGHDAPSN